MGTGPPDKPDDCPCDHAGETPPAPATPGEGRPTRILLIDDDEGDFFLTRDILSDLPPGRYTLDWIDSYELGIEAICQHVHDVYLIDYRLGAQTGIELIQEAQTRGCKGPVILLTGQGRLTTDMEALSAGADDYLEKAGLTAAALERAIAYALRQHRAEAELERKVQERTEELAAANQALRDADRRKDEFLATLAHELRNPLAPIRNALELLRLAPALPPAIDRQRERMERQVAVLVRLIDDLLDVSRITNGKLRLTTEVVPLQDVIEAAVEVSRPLLEKHQLTFTVTVPEAPILLTADRVRLAQVFANLLNNAAKYTEPGGTVTLTAEPADREVVVTVRDTGAGIPADVLPQVFELFTQVDRTLERSQGGLGIGLALVRRLTEMHGGTVTAHSDGPGKGAAFAVTLPVEPGAA